MRKVAFLFSGQGSQAVGMGAALADQFPEARAAFEQARDLLGWDLLQACREGPEDRLRQTDVAQPALYVTGYATSAVLQSLGVKPEGVAGHSIGEYAALAAAQVFSFAEGFALVRERGRLMQAAAQAHPGGMVAILGLDSVRVDSLCEEAQSQGICVAVNYNSPEQIVIAGETAALEEAGRLAREKGAKRVLPLNVSGAFHSPLMKDAAEAMRQRLQQVAFRPPIVPIAMNADGALHESSAGIQNCLALQLDHSVQWVRSIQSLKEKGYSLFVECGPGRVLTGLLRRIDRDSQAYPTDSPEALQQVLETLSPSSRKGTT